ncbi:MAG: DUF748 domain-containing protein [Bdellovibrio sp.]
MKNKWLGIVILALIGLRVFLPTGVKYGINWYLDKKLENYQGRINDFDLALYRGAYQIQDLKIWQRNKSEKDPLVTIKEIDLSLAWRALFQGKLLGDLKVKEMVLEFIDSEDKKKKQFGTEEDWKTVVGKLIPIELESFKLTDSSIRFFNHDFKVPVDLVVDRIQLEATNIKNTDRSKELLPSTVLASGRIQKDADINGKGRVNLLAKIPTFEAKVTLNKLDVTKLNKFFLGYGPFTLSSGHFSLFAEASTKDNKIVGYIKPFFENIDVMSPHEKYDSPKRFFNEVAIAWANMLLRNGETKTVATKIEFQGAAMSPDVNKWGALWTSLRNGFIEALKKQLDNTISIKDVPKKH